MSSLLFTDLLLLQLLLLLTGSTKLMLRLRRRYRANNRLLLSKAACLTAGNLSFNSVYLVNYLLVLLEQPCKLLLSQSGVGLRSKDT